MNISLAKEEIKNTVKAYLKKDEGGFFEIPVMRQRPILLMGAPGLGKTAIMRQIAEEAGIGFVSYNMTHHTRQSALGLPMIQKNKYAGKERDVTAYTMSEIVASIYDLMKETGYTEGILFLDEINCVSETLTPVILQLLQAKMFGRERVPEGWIIVAAGNPAEFNRSVREFDMATLDRVRLIEIEPDADVWHTYASGAGVHGAVLSYLNIHKENFYKAYITADGMSFVTARGWEDLSNLLKAYEALGIDADYPQIFQFIRDTAIAADFAAFYDMYKRYAKVYMIEDILRSKASDSVKNSFKEAGLDEKIGVLGLISARMNTEFKKFAKVRLSADRLFSMVKRVNEGYALADEVQLLKEEMFKEGAAGLLSDERSAALGLAADTAGEWIGRGSDQNTEGLKEEFFKFNENVEEEADKIRAKLDSIYDFLEETKGDGTELVLFTTELASGSRSLDFIRSEGYDRFFAYNKELLGG